MKKVEMDSACSTHGIDNKFLSTNLNVKTTSVT
jgi:hypothetical protein